MKTAKFIKNVTEQFKGTANLYQLSEPVKHANGKKTTFVVCSTVNVPFSGIETYIFPASDKGEILDWLELPGSTRGKTTDAEVLQELGYTLL